MRSFLLPTAVAACCGVLAAQVDAQPVPASGTRSETTPAAAAAKPAISQQVKVAPGSLRGRMLDAATRAPLGDRSFQLTDEAGKQLADVRTAADGTYVLPKLGVGSYVLVLDSNLKLGLAVEEAATATQLDLVLPQGKGQNPSPQDPLSYPPAPGGAAPLPPKPAPVPVAGMGFGSWALVAGGAAIVATPVVANNTGGGGKEPPVSGSGLGVRR